MNTIYLVQTTVDTQHTAKILAEQMIAHHLAACVSISGVSFESHYVWEGQLECQEEYILLIKTSSERLDALVAFLKTQHPYDVPEIIMNKVACLNPDYYQWVLAQTINE